MAIGRNDCREALLFQSLINTQANKHRGQNIAAGLTKYTSTQIKEKASLFKKPG